MMKNRIVRLSTIAFSLFALAVSYGVHMDAQTPAKAKKDRSANQKGPRSAAKQEKKRMGRSAFNMFRVKIDRSGDLAKYQASGKELVEKINKNINEKNERAAYRALSMYVNKAGSAKFMGDKYYDAASATLKGVEGKFTNKKITAKIAKLKAEINDPKARALKAEKKAKWRSEWKARSAKKAQNKGAKKARN